MDVYLKSLYHISVGVINTSNPHITSGWMVKLKKKKSRGGALLQWTLNETSTGAQPVEAPSIFDSQAEIKHTHLPQICPEAPTS